MARMALKISFHSRSQDSQASQQVGNYGNSPLVSALGCFDPECAAELRLESRALFPMLSAINSWYLPGVSCH